MRISDWSSDVCSSDLIIGRPLEASRRLPIALAHTDVVEEYHASITRDRIDQCRVPVIHRPAEAVQKYDRNAVRAFVSHAAIGNPMPVGHCEPRFSGLGLDVAAHPETREATGRGSTLEVSLDRKSTRLNSSH